jgi:hypothetical protein
MASQRYFSSESTKRENGADHIRRAMGGFCRRSAGAVLFVRSLILWKGKDHGNCMSNIVLCLAGRRFCAGMYLQTDQKAVAELVRYSDLGGRR